jgi:muconolactone delta-isomerase
MNEYMVDIDLPELTQEFVSLIPSQIVTTNKLMKSGKISSYTLSSDRTKLWVLINAESEKEATDILKTFPIYPYLDFNIYKLAFNNTISVFLPKLSLN